MKAYGFREAVLIVFSGAGISVSIAADDAPKAVRQRRFEFVYAGQIRELPANKTVHVWMPVPPSDADQTVRMIAKHAPAEAQINRERTHDNQVLYFEAQPDANGDIAFELVYDVLRHEIQFPKARQNGKAEDVERYLRADSRVPVGGKSLELLKGKTVPDDALSAAHVFYETVNQHMRYLKQGTGWGEGDADWACGSGYGNCSDFHSVFIALARAHRIPAKFEIGFPLPDERGAGVISGYHCWAKFRVAGTGWVPVDISEANKHPDMATYYFGNLTENRVAFSMGRDLELVPRQAGAPLNFFVYPYAEFDGKAVPPAQIHARYQYRDQGGK